ncbi:spinocerebellar ataxia type 10 protein domain-containing protein [Kalaharituber pfeilii]|nr:spinocerebellar ataxia type 10 protein domain-containing protein [Kalaharituber pfeilii]
MSELLADLLITVLFGTQASFTHPGVILPDKESLCDNELKAIVLKSQRDKESREVLGYSLRVWRALTSTLRSGNEQLMENKHHLLSKVLDLTSLGRNLLVAKEKAQDLAAEEGFEAEIRKLIEICVEKATKPISPTLDKGHHEKEMKVKQGYKRVLITALQFLNNLISGNETRKVHLWMHLFVSPPGHRSNSEDGEDQKGEKTVAGEPSEPSTATTPLANQQEKEAIKQAAKQQAESASIQESLITSLPTGFYSGFASLANSFNYIYYNPGLLTDVPRILGPSEIEALPMIVQTGISPLEGSDQDMQSVRCNILLAQETGRALLQELLVFLGAWEVEEHDFCYKMMQSIIEAILLNGLVPFAYEAFKDDKDIITPAQCVLLKLLVSIYRSPLPSANNGEPLKTSKVIPSMTFIPLRLGNQRLVSSKFTFPSSSKSHDQKGQAGKAPVTTPLPYPAILDTSIAAYLIHVFRKDVLPNIRRIILQQGAIKNGELKRENFEWSLWDLDRVYEGLYQFMEMLVVFAEDEEAKKIMLADVQTDKEGGLVGELVGFLVEMDRIIPRYLSTKPQPQPAQNPPPPPENTKPGVGIVERPYDTFPDSDHHHQDDDTTSLSEIYDAEGDEEEGDATLTEPEEFTWPHMKKFAVLLLSNLAWKNNDVKDLVREKGGLHAVLNQCMIDDDNPYIREYAILCIRNLLEGNLKNQKEIGELEVKEVVKSDALINAGYETYVDDKGKVTLKKAGTAQSALK